ncbi:MAG: histidine--tRNA ligase, partial [Alphaproteobacteria bacterium]|nr:histidine--tRNA ligase [Alphaproteobacteria bacterium]
MSQQKASRPKARLPRGFRDRSAGEIAAERRLIDTIRGVYESYGFSPLETPAFEYTDALGKFLPDVDRPNEGVFSLKDDDEQWLSLRYDLTAPLARYVAENFQNLAKPFRRYQVGPVWRNEKPGPGRFREFTQFDADTVGSNSPAADAELLMMVCDALEALGLKRGEFIIKVNNRKLLDGILEEIGVVASDAAKRGIVLRALDKLDRLQFDGVKALLGKGRKDESGDFTKGAELSDEHIAKLLHFVTLPPMNEQSETAGSPDDLVRVAVFGDQTVRRPITNEAIIEHLRGLSTTGLYAKGLEELEQIALLVGRLGFGTQRICIDPSIIRGLDYYTGPVFEAQLTFPVTNEAGETVVFGSVAGGGRYDDLVARFTGQQVPATGISIGVSRLLTALRSRGLTGDEQPLIVVLSMGDAAASFATARELRASGLRAESYVGTKKIPDQLKYADKRGAALVVMEGEDERAKGEVTIKDLKLGAEISKTTESRAEWVGARAAQETVKR